MRDKEEAKKLLGIYWHDENGHYSKEKFEAHDFNESERTKCDRKFLFKETDILNPSKSTYITVRRWIKAIKENTLAAYGEGSSVTRYNCLLMVLAAIELCVTDTQMELWESDPTVQLLNRETVR